MHWISSAKIGYHHFWNRFKFFFNKNRFQKFHHLNLVLIRKFDPKNTVKIEKFDDFLLSFLRKGFFCKQKSVTFAIWISPKMTYQSFFPPWAFKKIARIFIPWFLGVSWTNCVIAFLAFCLVTYPLNLIFISNPWQFFANLFVF